MLIQKRTWQLTNFVVSAYHKDKRNATQGQQKENTYHQVSFAVPVDHRVKVKESKKIGKFLDLVRELKKL